MKKFILFLIFSSPSFAQNMKALLPVPPVGQAVIHDVRDPLSGGFVQYRSVLSPMWAALSPGMKLGEGVLIRINDPNAQLTMGFPDGSFLRIIGVSSLYLDSISRITSYSNEASKTQDLTAKSSYQTRILLLSGRWFYSANPMTPSTFVANTDITTSVIENGSGGGYYIQGQGEMLVRSGIGRFGWRLTNDASGTVRSRPILLEPGQIITMDIFKGFPTTMAVISESNYAEYGLFPPQTPISSEGGLSYWPQAFAAQDKSGLTRDHINFEGLDSLKNLQFVRKGDALALGVAKAITNITVEMPPEVVLPKAIPLALLKPIDLADFEVATPRAVADNPPIKQKEPQPQVSIIPRVRKKIKAPPPPPALETNILAVSQVSVVTETIDLIAATADIKATPIISASARRAAVPDFSAPQAETPPPKKVSPKKSSAKKSSVKKASVKKAPTAPTDAPIENKIPNEAEMLKIPSDFQNLDRQYLTNSSGFQNKKFRVDKFKENLMKKNYTH